MDQPNNLTKKLSQHIQICHVILATPGAGRQHHEIEKRT
jgi:hypothetical protein